MFVDLVSDLHVEYWKDKPYNWKKNKTDNANIVIIAGDLSANITITIDELHKACDVYEFVLFVDGNHEAYNFQPLDKVVNIIAKSMAHRKNFIYLSKNNFVKDDWEFIGINGWWDFQMSRNGLRFDDLWKNYVKSYDENWYYYFLQANKDFKIISERINNSKKKIIIVTHTCPNKLCLKSHNNNIDTGNSGNTLFQKFETHNKIHYFLFGHVHNNKGLWSHKNKLYINNARGRPNDSPEHSEYFPYCLELP